MDCLFGLGHCRYSEFCIVKLNCTNGILKEAQNTYCIVDDFKIVGVRCGLLANAVDRQFKDLGLNPGPKKYSKIFPVKKPGFLTYENESSMEWV